MIGSMRSLDSCVPLSGARTTRNRVCATSLPENAEEIRDVFRDLRRRHDLPTAIMHPPVTPSAAPSKLGAVHFRVTRDISVEPRRSAGTFTWYVLGILE